MDPLTGPAQVTIRSLFWKLTGILEEDADGFLDEVSSLLPTSQEMYKNPTASGTQHERVEKTLNLILTKGEETCMKFLQHLENMIIRFPKLSSLSGDFPEKKKYFFDETLQHLGTEDCTTSKLSLNNILSIRKENRKDTDLQSIHLHFLRKLLALNRNARNTYSEENSMQMESSVDDEEYDDFNGASPSVHPLDVVCALLHCSDHFLQQEIVSKMSMCQFAVPLLLPAGDGTYCTLMLWAMRDIVKRWRPHSLADSKGFMEDNVVNVPMPTFSFVRLGKTKLSKSKILNQVLSQDQQHLDFFIHYDMDGGNIKRKISNGLVEMSWYFPSGSKTDIFPEPIAVTNLRGDLESNWNQFSFLTRVSSAVFIFTERIGEREFRILSNCDTSSTKYYLIISPNTRGDISCEKYENLKQTGNICILSKTKTENDRALVKKIRHYITKSLTSFSKKEIETMKEQVLGLGIQVDEHVAECSKAKEHAEEITNAIKDVAQYKNETMSLQGERWKEISKLEKEMCRMRKQGKKNVQEYQSELIHKINELYEKQYACTLPHGMEMFIKVMELPLTDKHNFLKYMKIGLGSIVRKKLLPLQAEYKEKCKGTENQDEIKELDQKISHSSLGIEHFLREMGQFYEAECVMSGGKKCETDEEKDARLPEMAADLLLDGFPLELIDGDASNIPMQWITDVLKKVDTKTGGRCRMRVITVLGVQSTGKSTLLNTMFGLQFPVASGRCTRGAFMTLIRVEVDFMEELGCDFILVIDTEGLKAPELASLEDSYEHDNELATLVIGLSDITIINMAMENAAEMIDTLQIVVHAFLRMKEIGKKPKCLFAHQNVSDVSNYVNNMRDRKKLRDMLDKMTMTAAKMENKSTIKTFNDMIDYDIEKDNWYIPGLWLGGPPMAAVNLGYSENVSEMKKYLLTLMGPNASMNKAQTFSGFIEWVKSLWKAAKHERFIFSFRNSLVAQAYQKLSMRFSQWEWNFTKAVYRWENDAEMRIRNLSPDTLQEDVFTSCQKTELHSLLHNEKEKMLKLLENYFEDDSDSSVHLIERYKEEYRVCVAFLKNELERNATNSFNKTFQNQKWKFNIQRVLDKYQEMLESKVINLLGKYGEERCEMSDTKLEEEFEVIWKETMSDLQAEPLLKCNISQSMLNQLHNNMSSKGPEVNEKMCNNISLEEYANNPGMEWKHKLFSLNDEASREKLSEHIDSLMGQCDQKVTEKTNVKSDYNDTHCQELLRLIDEYLEEMKANDLQIPSLIELEVKLVVLGRAAKSFQSMHEEFIQENDPIKILEKLKSNYCKTFCSIYQNIDESKQRAKRYCDVCLRPAFHEYIYRHLGQEIVDDILSRSDDNIFMNRSYFQATVMKYLLEREDFEHFLVYITSYEHYIERWIEDYISKKYNETQLETLQGKILAKIIKKITDFLSDGKCLNSPNIRSLLENLTEEFRSELFISQNAIKMVTLGSKVDVKQFSSDIQSFLKETQNKTQSGARNLDIKSILSEVTVKPQDELLKKVKGCGKQCPFCKVPCEAGGSGHKEHRASIHRPQGLGGIKKTAFNQLIPDICSQSILTKDTFLTDGVLHPYRDYHKIYPDWSIQPDRSIESSDYWKYVFVKFNDQFAEKWKVKPAKIPEGWKGITKEQALRSLKEAFNVK